MTYDKLVSLITKTCVDHNTVITNTYNQSDAESSKGLLASTTYSNGSSVSYVYDDLKE